MAQIKGLKLQMLSLLTEATVICHGQKNQILLIHNGNKEKREEKI